jgi:IS5 family transposase
MDARALVGHLVAPDSVFGFLADHRRHVFPDRLFEDLFPSSTGRPSVPADVAATVLVLQTLHGLSDRDTVEALRCDLRWKVACGLALDDEGFHPSTLTYWRRRLAASDRPQRIFDAVKVVIAQTGVLTGRDRRVLDSAVLDDAVATQDTVTQLIAAVRRVRREVPQAAEVIAGCSAHDWDDPGKPAIAWDDPAARDALVSALVTDAGTIVDAMAARSDLSDGQAETVALLALVAGQDVEPAKGSDGTDGRWRIARRVAEDRVISVHDPDTRHVHKTVHHRQDGFKAHLAVEPDTGLVTACRLTKATGADNHEAAVAVDLLADEPAGRQVLGDAAYGTGELRAALAAAGHTAIIKPPPLRPAVPGGYTIDDFVIDTAAGTLTCPAGHAVAITPTGRAVFGHRCAGCPLRARCTTAARGRTIHVHPQHDLLAAARRFATTEAFTGPYRKHRPMVERSIAWLVRGNRRVPYRGITANNWWLHTHTAALNLRRLINLGLHHQHTAWALIPTAG